MSKILINFKFVNLLDLLDTGKGLKLYVFVLLLYTWMKKGIVIFHT